MDELQDVLDELNKCLDKLGYMGHKVRYTRIQSEETAVIFISDVIIQNDRIVKVFKWRGCER